MNATQYGTYRVTGNSPGIDEADECCKWVQETKTADGATAGLGWNVTAKVDEPHTCRTCAEWESWVGMPAFSRATDAAMCGECPKLTAAEYSNAVRVYDDSTPITTECDFGCIHWRAKE